MSSKAAPHVTVHPIMPAMDERHVGPFKSFYEGWYDTFCPAGEPIPPGVPFVLNVAPAGHTSTEWTQARNLAEGLYGRLESASGYAVSLVCEKDGRLSLVFVPSGSEKDEKDIAKRHLRAIWGGIW